MGMVRLPDRFIRAFMTHEDELPVVTAIATQPIVLADGGILAQSRGLDRDRGILFHISPELIQLLPKRKDCTPAAVAKAMKFLTDDWLCDVRTSYAGKCTLIALALTLIQRSLLPNRPVFWVTAAKRGGGKTTTLMMLIEAVTGIAAAAAAWSYDEVERKKAIFSYFLQGVPYILWDNIKRGSRIFCPYIEASCTTAMYMDRKLGVSEIIATSAATIHLFTGNNVGPKGDLMSRSLQVDLQVDEVDPENRKFKHQDIIGWTQSHRGEILQALYTILLGNPALDLPRNAEMRTRFKMWQRMIGSAVEHAAKCVDEKQVIDFGTLFLKQEEDDEEAASLVEVLDILDKEMSTNLNSPTPLLNPVDHKFKAGDMAKWLNGIQLDDDALTVRGFLFPGWPPNATIKAEKASAALRGHLGRWERYGDKEIRLTKIWDSHANVTLFYVERREKK
jgi:hypothetical protein